jgi:hypothetical protein
MLERCPLKASLAGFGLLGKGEGRGTPSEFETKHYNALDSLKIAA